MTTSIYFVRHGEVDNPNKVFYGRLPGFGLTKKGRREIEETAKKLLKKNIAVIFSSPLLRARQSAEIIKQILGLKKIHFSKDILEIDSSLQGSSDEFLQTIHYDVLASNKNNVRGETAQELEERMKKFIEKVVRKYKGKNIVAVSHGDPIMAVKILNEGLTISNSALRPDKGDYIKTGEFYLVKK